MALKVELKPHERIIIGNCVVTNTDQRARLLIDGDRIPILREKDIQTPETADTPGKLIYLAVQLMYLSPDPMAHHPTFFSLVRDVLATMPSAWPFIEGINNNILNGDLYHALKEAKKLIGHEEKLIHDAKEMRDAERISAKRQRARATRGLRNGAFFVAGAAMTTSRRNGSPAPSDTIASLTSPAAETARPAPRARPRRAIAASRIQAPPRSGRRYHRCRCGD
jgi:flagellar biosynthesis repressor protein FlbT